MVTGSRSRTIGAQVPGYQGAAGGVGEDHGLGRGIERIERGLIAAVRHIHAHAHLFHALHDRQPEDRKAAIAPLQKAAADVGQLRDALAQAEERVHITGAAKMRGVLHGQHDADLAGLVRAFEIARAGDAQQPSPARRL
jgi:hypothetical protein